jgi:adenylate cyclase
MLMAQSLKSRVEPCAPNAKEVNSYLRELLGQEAFSTSERNRRFLSYVVQETLEGRADRIKAYNIALAAFDRTEDFDPLTDPIVRIEASRLRRALEHYYLTTGQSDRIRIDIPKGSYAATFTYQGEAAEELPQSAEPATSEACVAPPPRCASPARFTWPTLAAAMAALGLIVGSISSYAIMKHSHRATGDAAGPDPPSLVIVPFEDTGGDPSRSFVARGLTYDVGTALTQLEDVAVFGSRHPLGVDVAVPEFKGDFAIMGSVQTDQYSMRVAVFLLDSRTGQFLQSWSFQKDLITRDLINTQSEIAQQILASLKSRCTRAAMNLSEAGQSSFDCRPLAIAARAARYVAYRKLPERR